MHFFRVYKYTIEEEEEEWDRYEPSADTAASCIEERGTSTIAPEREKVEREKDIPLIFPSLSISCDRNLGTSRSQSGKNLGRSENQRLNDILENIYIAYINICILKKYRLSSRPALS